MGRKPAAKPQTSPPDDLEDDKPLRRELYKGQLNTQYTRLANNGFGITKPGILRFLRWFDPEDLGTVTFFPLHSSQLSSFICVTSHRNKLSQIVILFQWDWQDRMIRMES